jgi:hypothetical protein
MEIECFLLGRDNILGLGNNVLFLQEKCLNSVEQYSKFRSTKFLVHANGIIIFVKIEKTNKR